MVGVAIGPDGSLLAADDVADVIWRVTGPKGRQSDCETMEGARDRAVR